MTQQEIEIISQFLIKYGYEAVLAGIVVFFLIKFFLPGYLTEKGKNLATSEDIQKMTQKIESIKADYSVLLEELKSKHQLKLAAIDRRLEVHQEAFALWRELMTHVHTKEIGNITKKCNVWWEENCLYLEPNAREAFSTAYHAAASHKEILQIRDAELAIDNMLKVRAAGQIIVEAVKLPRLSDAELKELNNTND